MRDIQNAVREVFEEVLSTHDCLHPQPVDEIGGIELAIELTGLSKATIYSHVCKRKIPHFKRGKRLYFARRELISWLREGRRRTHQEIVSGVKVCHKSGGNLGGNQKRPPSQRP